MVENSDIRPDASETIRRFTMKKLAIIGALALGSMAVVSATAMAQDLLAGIPAPANSTKLGGGPAQGGGERVSYSTSETPGAVIGAYEKALPAAGWTVGESGGGGGDYGGGAGLQATSGEKFLTVTAGGPAGRTFVHVCAWPAKPKDDHCGD
jgi:hypothetical protein